ncbi:MAG: N-6 DNA methylase [Bacteroidetes bacterium]|nr:N-6 DNA methylase [Bacteroidota bacterium]
MIKEYLKELLSVSQSGDAREESFYTALKNLLENYASTKNLKKIHITILPKKTKAGNPDFRVWDGKQHIVGYIEAKAITEKNLDLIEDSEQLKRYRHTFPNLILTNFFEFRLYRNGTLTEKVQIARPFIIYKLGTTPPVENETEFFQLLEKYFSFSLPKIYNARTLAMELAKRTRFLKDEVISEEIREEEEGKTGNILGFYKTFHKYLIYGLTKEDFADLYSQTITYGLFAARSRTTDVFNRKLAYDNIPHTIGILRDVFHFISLGDLPEQMEWIIDDIAELLEVTDVNKILHDYFHEGKGKDPVVHFYETFLSEYDPETRERRGVYYTPEPVVSYIVRSVNHILKTHFNRPDGFASENVTVLDPAAGTLTFLAEAAKVAVDEFTSKYGEGGKSDFIKNHILKNFYAFELMMAPYAIGHLKMSFLLDELGYKLHGDDRFQYYLTNTLEIEELSQSTLPFAQSLTEESISAGKIKKEKPILVILGNPPYSGISANLADRKVKVEKGKTYVTHYRIQKINNVWVPIAEERKATRNIKIKQKTWIGELIEHYKIVDGNWFGERKHWLQDDYVKFIRFAQWKIDQTGEGVLGFITNHSYLDNPTFRGMRQSLMNSFDEIYILDLHGNSMKKETCPDGSKDENVFDIRQGVAIALFIKQRNRSHIEGRSDKAVHSASEIAKPLQQVGGTRNDMKGVEVFHTDLYGKRQPKNDWLSENDFTTTELKEIKPNSPYYFFVPRLETGRKMYEDFIKITDIFPVNVTGIVTARDKFVIDHNRESLKARIRTFIDEKNTDDYIKELLRGILGRKKVEDVENYAWRVSKARQLLKKVKNIERYFTRIMYRPFDIREIFFHDSVVWRTRKKVMRHMLQKNLGLVTSRQTQIIFRHVFVTNIITDFNLTGTAGKYGSGYLFPLYLYNDTNKHDLFLKSDQSDRKPNIHSKILSAVSNLDGFENLQGCNIPETIFYYIYAVLYAPTYRTKYTEFLKIDFPRVPFAGDAQLFKQLAGYGKRLVELHLIKSTELVTPIARFQGDGDNRVVKIRYETTVKIKDVIFINEKQYFEGIPQNVWEYQIGGYQVCAKWLKDRKGRVLSLDEIKTYCRIVTALAKTISIQKNIDELYPNVEKDLIEF